MPAPGRNRLLLTGQQAFSPASIAGLKLWLDASRITGLVDGDPVGTWSDLSGNGNHATQATAAKKPTYKTGIQNGKPIVRFDGVDDVLALTGTGLAILKNLSGLSIYLVLQTTKPGSDKRPLTIAANGNTLSRFMIARERVAGEIEAGGRRLDADAFQQVSGGSFTAGVWNINSAIVDYATAALTLYKDGTSIATTAAFQTAGVSENTDAGSVAIGASSVGGIDANFITGDIAEILWYTTTHSASQQAQVQSYLKQKWATP